MSISELLVIFLVALLVFDTKKLPMLASHTGILLRKVQKIFYNLQKEWHTLAQTHQLTENEKKAKVADSHYAPPKKDASLSATDGCDKESG